MTIYEAYQILGVSEDADDSTIKKQYRRLMHIAHPDANAFRNQETKLKYSAQEINEAYSKIMNRGEENTEYFTKAEKNTRRKSKKEKEKQKTQWKAPENQTAFCTRKVFHAVEDGDGERLGSFCVGEGKYFWTPDEDFSLFQRSVYLAGKELLDQIDEKRGYGATMEERMPILAELTYLLSGQFIDSVAALKHLAERYREADRQQKKANPEQGNAGQYEEFHIVAMAELQNVEMKLKPGESIYPSGVRKHRLFLKTADETQIGYLSFRDDRLYYVVVPLFEQKSVQIKMCVAEKQMDGFGKSEQRKKQEKYRKLDLWIRFQKNEKNTYPESISLKIEKLLEQYKNL